MAKTRLDQKLVQLGLAPTRSQAESYIKLGYVTVDQKVVLKPGELISENKDIKLNKSEKYVSRAGLKLEAANKIFNINFNNKIVLDIGSSTGGFTDYALQNGAQKIIAVDVGTEQLHPSLRHNPKIELHEKTDIRDFNIQNMPDIILADVSFISLRQILPVINSMATAETDIVVLFKPQFEAQPSQVNRGVIKNSRVRRDLIASFEGWTNNLFKTLGKVDSEIAGAKGNIERLYYFRKTK